MNQRDANKTIMAWVAAILLGAVAALVGNTLPVFLTVMSRTLGFDESQCGLIAFAEMGGMAAGTIGCALLPRMVERLSWRGTAVLGLVVLVTANGFAMLADSFGGLLFARTMAGVGAGFVLAITYAVLAGGNGARALALFNVVQLLTGGFGMLLLSPIAGRYGAGGLFGIIAGISLLAMVLCPWLPKIHRADSPTESVTYEHVSARGWMAVASAFLYFTAVSAIFAYVAFMGVAWGGNATTVEASTSMAMFAGMVGAVTVALIGSRFGYLKPLYLGYALLLPIILLFALVQPVAAFLPLASVFGFAWNIVTPYQFAAITHVDSSVGAAMLVNAATLGGFAVGPALAGYLASSDYMLVNLLAFAGGLLSLALLLGALRMRRNPSAYLFATEVS